MITIDDFKKLDMRVGKVISATAVPDSDKLIHFVLDFGEESHRTILSAIREYYTEPEKLVGMTMLFVINLEPRTIRGLESQGMLMAVGEDKPIFLIPSESVTPGSKVR